MSHIDRSSIRSVLMAKDLESFVDTYPISERVSLTLLGLDDPAECSPKKIAIYTLSFFSCGVRYHLSAFKVDLLKHFGIHFSQLHPLAFMRVVHFELSCVAVSGEPSVPLFYIFYRLLSYDDWFTFAKRKDSIVQWKRMYENPTRAFTFPEGVLAMEGLSPLYLVWPKDFFGKKGISVPGLLCLDDLVDLDMSRGLEKKAPGTGSSVHVGDSVAEEKDENVSSNEAGDSRGSLRVKGSSDDEDDEDLESRLLHKRKAAQASIPKAAPAPRNIRLRLRSASGQKPFPAIKAASEIPPAGTKGSLSKHLRSSSLVSDPLLGSSKALIVIPPVPAFSQVGDKTPEVTIARVNPAFDISPLQATGTSKPSHPEVLPSRSPLAPLFAEGLLVPYVSKWKVTTSTVMGTPETARDYLDHDVPPPHKFMNFALNLDLFDDQYSMSLCEGFFKGAGMLQRVDELRKANEELRTELRTSQTVAAELRCQLIDVEKKLLEEKNVGAVLEQRERAWERERSTWAKEKEELVADLKHQKELDSVSHGDLDTMYAEWGITMDDNQKLVQERYWLITQGFGSFLTVVS
ncbi:hypothetical protein Hdeb2414_s0004g00133151 [Helianthus debilis subsp. tardiflorus]